MSLAPGLSRDEIETRARALGPGFHNMELNGVWTAPDHFLGDYPGVKFRRFGQVIPADLTGKSVLDIGCNGGFYSIEMKRRGASRVLGIDFDEDYLAQARFAAEVTGQDIEFRQLSVYDLGALGETFDLVIFMGVLYHLRHPLLALDIIHDTVAKDLMLFQSMQRGSNTVDPVAEDYDFFEQDHFDSPGYPKMHFIEHRYSNDPTNWWAPNAACSAAMLRSAGFEIVAHPEDEVFLCRRVAIQSPGAVYPTKGVPPVIEAVMLWNEPNNKSHWDPAVDPDWSKFGTMIKLGAQAIRAENSFVPRVLGGMSPIDATFVNNLAGQGVLDHLEAIAVHGFPMDWNLWALNDWPQKIDEIRAVTHLPVWVSEVGVSTFGAEEVQDWGLKRTVELLRGKAPRIHWYSLYDLPREWEATTRHKEAEGSSYYRHFALGLLREDGTPKLAATHFYECTPDIGLCQWFHFEDHRLDDAVETMKRMGVTYLRTGLSWADWFRPDAERWFDRLVRALEPFRVTATFCFTPEHLGIEPHHTSAPREPEAFADFCATMVRRYVGTGPTPVIPGMG